MHSKASLMQGMSEKLFAMVKIKMNSDHAPLILFLPLFSRENQGETQVLPVLPGMAPLK